MGLFLYKHLALVVWFLFFNIMQLYYIISSVYIFILKYDKLRKKKEKKLKNGYKEGQIKKNKKLKKAKKEKKSL